MEPLTANGRLIYRVRSRFRFRRVSLRMRYRFERSAAKMSVDGMGSLPPYMRAGTTCSVVCTGILYEPDLSIFSTADVRKHYSSSLYEKIRRFEVGSPASDIRWCHIVAW